MGWNVFGEEWTMVNREATEEASLWPSMTELAMRMRCRKRSEFIRTLSRFNVRAERCHGILL